MKATQCKLTFCGTRRIIEMGMFERISAAKKTVRDCWDRSCWNRQYGKPYKKSKSASQVLSLMDSDFSYQKALQITLLANKGVNKAQLEKELDTYI